jgi:subtilisin family serine protease
MQKSKLTLAVIGALFAMSADAGTYVLQANKWGAVQEAAVAAAGGRVVYASAGAGLAVVDSDNADFASAMRASRAVTDVDADVVLDFDVPKSYDLEAEAGVTLGSETFWNLQWAPRAIEAPAAWAAGYTGAGVRVAVIDGGVHSTHVDLAARLDMAKSRNFTVPAGATAAGCTSAASNWNCDRGTFWHGTHVSGIIAARGDNNRGTVGIAPDATIVALKALHNGSGSFGWIIAAMLYAADEADVSVINMSLGAETPRRQNAGLVAALNRAVNYATAKGSLVVVAAGNSGYDMDKPPESVEVSPGVFEPLGPSTIVVPAESGNAIAVSATAPIGYYAAGGSTYAATPTSYTNYGNSLVWVSGPGGDSAYPGNENCTVAALPAGTITNPCWVFDLVLAPSRGAAASTASYSWAAGTSMAAPAAAAVAALIKQKYPNAGPALLKTKLAQSATDEGKTGQDPMHGHGFVNARRAVTQ